MGFPLSIGVAFILIFSALPFLMSAMERIIDSGFGALGTVINSLGGTG
jgi:flagellar biosynthesis protein FliR